jgi:hypothetical protein
MKKLIALYLLVWLFVGVFGQTLKYDVILFGDKIGSLTAVRNVKPDSTVEYHVASSSEAKVLWVNKKSKLNSDVVFKGGKLQSSLVKNITEEAEKEIRILWDKAKYIIEKGNETIVCTENICYTTTMLYFWEPKNINRIFSERVGIFVKLMKNSDGNYEMTMPDGVTSIFKYRNGIAYEIELKKTLGSVYLKLVQ